MIIQTNPTQLKLNWVYLAHIIRARYIHPHLVDFYGKCIPYTWILWVGISPLTTMNKAHLMKVCHCLISPDPTPFFFFSTPGPHREIEIPGTQGVGSQKVLAIQGCGRHTLPETNIAHENHHVSW